MRLPTYISGGISKLIYYAVLIYKARLLISLSSLSPWHKLLLVTDSKVAFTLTRVPVCVQVRVIQMSEACMSGAFKVT